MAHDRLIDEVMAYLQEEDKPILLIIKKSIQALEALDVELKTEDAAELALAVGRVTNHIKNICNIDEVPEGLVYVAVDMVCGEVLSGRKTTGRLGDQEVQAIIKSIKVGDTQTTYQDSDAVTLDGYIHQLRYGREGELLSFRKLKW